nr:hypothetical protein [Tanacetum cinerariifolium]
MGVQEESGPEMASVQGQFVEQATTTTPSIQSATTEHKALYYALMESILEDEEDMDEGVAKKLKKRKLDDADKDKAILLDQTKGSSSDGVGLQPEVLDEPKGKSVDTHKGTGLKSRVFDVSKADSFESEDTKKQEKMYYPRFTKAIIHHFVTKDKSISMRNIMFMHTAEDDIILGLMRFVSKYEDFQVYGALLPEVMTNQKMRNSDAYKTYLAYATGAATPKKASEFKKHASLFKNRTLVTVEEEEPCGHAVI